MQETRVLLAAVICCKNITAFCDVDVVFGMGGEPPVVDKLCLQQPRKFSIGALSQLSLCGLLNKPCLLCLFSINAIVSSECVISNVIAVLRNSGTIIFVRNSGTITF